MSEKIVGQCGHGMRLDRWIRREVGDITQGRLERLVRQARIRVDGKNTRSGARLIAGQTVSMPAMKPAAERPDPPQVPDHLARLIRDAVLYSDSDVIVLNKPAGLAVQGGTGTGIRHVDALSVALCDDRANKPMLVHRLDKATSGVLVLARHRRSAAYLSEGFRSRSIRKLYWAIVEGVPDPQAGEICDSDSLTRYRVIDTNAEQGMSWLALIPHTGRKHQLRRHMVSIGHPIVGDGRCARGRDHEFAGLHLHARRLWLPATGDQDSLWFEAPVPMRMKDSFAALGFVADTPGAELWE